MGSSTDSLDASSGPGAAAIGAANKTAVVDHVADGDTIQVQIGGREEDVRFIGIDTPGGLTAVSSAAAPMRRRR